MSILIACEESQVVTKEFRALGLEAYSCDILPCSGGRPEWHLQQDIGPLLKDDWDMIIAFPPCTYLSNAGIGWFNEDKHGAKAVERKANRIKAMEFVMNIFNSPCYKIAIENPVGWLNSHFRKPDQIIQPYWFGDTESKRTCLWLKGLPKLTHTKIVKPKIYAYYKTGKKKGQPIYGTSYLPFSEDRAIIRSKTFLGIAKAMAGQWADSIYIKQLSLFE